MYDRFTDRARKIMMLAQQEAQRYNHEYIGTEHIALGIIKEGTGVAAHVLQNHGIDTLKLRAAFESLMKVGPDVVSMGKLPLTPKAKKVVTEYSIEAARELNHNYVGTEHLLLGLLRETEGLGANILADFGLTYEKVRLEILRLICPDKYEEEMKEATQAQPEEKPQVLEPIPGVTMEERIRKVSEALWSISKSPAHPDPVVSAAVVSATGEIIKSMIIKGI